MPLLFAFSSVFGQERYTPLVVSDSDVMVDGRLDEAVWEQAVKVPIDIEISPAYNVPTKTESYAIMAYSKTHIYVGFRVFNPPKNIRASVRARDDFKIISDDHVVLRFDPYADGRNNYIFVLNPFGSQFDVRAVNATDDEGRYDSTFNANFISKGQLTDTGYEVELVIPFAEIPFPNGTNQTWHFNLARRYYDNGNLIELSSQERDRDNPCIVCQVTDIISFKDIIIEKRKELLPYVSGALQGDRSITSGTIDYDKPTAAVGIGVNLDLSKNTTLELTVNPDFSQVEADVTQIDVNSSFSLQYPERRPFFNRGTDLVQFTSEAFYSRAINSPIMASKLLSQGRQSRTYQLMSVDQQSPYLIAGEDQSYIAQGGTSYVNVLRHQRVLSKNSRLGMVTTNRFFKEGGYGNLFGIDGVFLIGNNWRFTFEMFQSYNEEPEADWFTSDATRFGNTIRLDGESYKGHAYYAQLYRNTEHWKSYLFYRQISPKYQADLGFIVKNNRKHGTFYHEYQNIINKKYVQSFGFGFKGDLVDTYQLRWEALSTDLFFQARVLGNTELAFIYDFDWFKEFLGTQYEKLGTAEFDVSGSPSEQFNFNLNIKSGKDLAYNEATPDVGRLLTVFFRSNIQWNDSFTITPSLRYSRLQRLDNSTNYFEGQIVRLNLQYQFSNYLNFRIISEHNTFNDRFYIQPLIQWNPNPATIFYLGGNQNTLEIDDDFTPELFRFTRSQFFLKFQYLIGI